jgi:hypothetical protein
VFVLSSVSSRPCGSLIADITAQRAARRKPNRLPAAQILDDVGLSGAAIPGAQRHAGRSCERSRPMRIFPIASGNYDRRVSARHTMHRRHGHSPRIRRARDDGLSVLAQRDANARTRHAFLRAFCAFSARIRPKLDQHFASPARAAASLVTLPA